MEGVGGRGISAVVAIAVLLAGCGGGSAKVTTSLPSTPSRQAAPDTPAQLAADTALAKRVGLRLGDLPAGYTAKPHDDSSDAIPAKVAKAFGSCAHIPKSSLSSLLGDVPDPSAPSVSAPDFELVLGSRHTSFENNVELDRTARDLSEPLALFGAPAALPCWKALFGAVLAQTAPKDGVFEGLIVQAIPISRIADQSAAFEAQVTLAVGRIAVPVVFDFFFVRLGRAGVTLFASGINHRVDTALEVSLIRKVVTRLRAAM
jgi:hypothetical protein